MPTRSLTRETGLATRRNRRRLLQLAVAAGGMLSLSNAARSVALRKTPATPGAAPPAGTPLATVTVTMTTQLRFEPATVTIRRGDTVTWVNASPIPHTTTGDPAKNPVKRTRPELAKLPPGAQGWDSGLLNQGQSFSRTFTVAGEYHYFCIPHVLSGMLGTVIVED